MANWLSALGGVGQGVTLGLQDIDAREAEKRRKAQFEQEQTLRALQLKEAQDLAAAREEVKGLQRPGTKSYAKALEQYGAGDQQARMLAAQTEDFGQEGADMTASALAGRQVQGLQPRVYTESAQTRDVAEIYRRRGMTKQAAEMSDRAVALAKREYEDKLMDYARRAPTMSLYEAAQELARIKTEDPTAVNAYTKLGADGLPTSRVYNVKSGDFVDVPVTNPQQLVGLAMAMRSPEAWQQYEKALREDAQLGIQGYTAGSGRISAEASKQQAETARETFIEQRLAKVWEASAGRDRAAAEAAKAEAGLAPARKAEIEARTKELDARVQKIKAEASDIDAKMDPAQKMFLDTLKARTKTLQAAAEKDPRLMPQLQMLEAQILREYQQAGVTQLNDQMVYAMSGIPTPESLADDIMRNFPGGRLTDAVISDQVQKLDKMYPGEGRKLRGILMNAKYGHTTSRGEGPGTAAPPPASAAQGVQLPFGIQLPTPIVGVR